MSVNVRERLLEIDPALLVPSSENPRIVDTASPGFLELVESVRAAGVLIPVHCRPHPEQAGCYDLRAGERRVRAALAAGRATVPAIVHDGMSDEEAFELTFAENFSREDLTPLEEGKAVAALMTRYGGDVAAVADKLGKPAGWVARRAAIDKHLTAVWRTELAREGSDFAEWTAAHLEQIARLPEDVQEDLVRPDNYLLRRVDSAADLARVLERVMRLLRKAPWKLDDETLVPEAGSCAACTKRTGAAPLLWDDGEEDDGNAVKRNDRCLDPDCWQGKADAYLECRAAELKAEHPKLVAVEGAGSMADYRQQERNEQRWGAYWRQWEYTTARKDDPQAMPALVVEGKGLGTLRWVKRESMYSPLSSDRPKGDDGKPKPRPLKERRAMLDAKRWAQVLVELRERVEAAPLSAITGPAPAVQVVALAAAFGTHERLDTVYGGRRKDAWPKARQVEAWLREDRPSGMDPTVGELVACPAVADLWGQVRKVLASRLTYPGGITQTPKIYIEEAKAVAALVGVDTDALFAEIATRKGFTEPKSWANLNADGTPKGAKTPKGKGKKTTKGTKPEKKGKAVSAGAKPEKETTEGEEGGRGYRDLDGDAVRVTNGLNGVWIVARGKRRVKSPKLPVCQDREACQRNLDAYAESQGWTPEDDTDA